MPTTTSATPTAASGPQAAHPPSRGRDRLRTSAAYLLAAGAGVLLYASFPPRTLWWLAPVAFAVLGALLRQARGDRTAAVGRRGFGLGFVFGLGFLLPLMAWTGELVGPVPWAALCVFESLFVGATGTVIALAARSRGRWASALWPLSGAALWVAGEALRGRVPFGGLPWGRAGLGQPDAPTLPVAALGGVPLLSFVTVLGGFALAALVLALVARPRRIAVSLVLLVLVAASGPLAALVPPVASGAGQRTVTVAAIQGNVPRLGLEFNAQRRAVLDNHVRVTEQLAADVAAGRTAQPDLVIWPENSSDIDPLRNADAAARIDEAATAIRAPILVGAVLVNGDRTTSNAALIWQAGQGVVARTDKRRIQPFGEYMPWRSFFRLFSSYVDRAGYFVPGPGDGVVPMAGVTVGVAICWEIAFDDLVEQSVDAGAGILAVPSNNATFELSEMTFQQLAMSRVRAVEHDRPVVVATTSGVSALIRPDGAVTASTGQFTPGVLVDRISLRQTTTLSGLLGAAPEWTIVGLGLLALVISVGASARRPAGAGVELRGSQGGKDEHG